MGPVAVLPDWNSSVGVAEREIVREVLAVRLDVGESAVCERDNNVADDVCVVDNVLRLVATVSLLTVLPKDTFLAMELLLRLNCDGFPP